MLGEELGLPGWDTSCGWLSKRGAKGRGRGEEGPQKAREGGEREEGSVKNRILLVLLYNYITILVLLYYIYYYISITILKKNIQSSRWWYQQDNVYICTPRSSYNACWQELRRGLRSLRTRSTWRPPPWLSSTSWAPSLRIEDVRLPALQLLQQRPPLATLLRKSRQASSILYHYIITVLYINIIIFIEFMIWFYFIV